MKIFDAIKEKVLFQKEKLTGEGSGFHEVKKELTAAAHKRAEDRIRKKEAEAQRRILADAIKQKHKEDQAAEAAKEVEREPKLPKQKKKHHLHRGHKHHLVLAGIKTDLITIYKRLFLATVFTTIALTLYAALVKFFFDQTFTSAQGVWSFMLFTGALWTFGFAAIFTLLTLGFFVYVDLLINQRRKEIETVLPDFLQLAAANLSAGMTLDRALWSAVRPRFGVLVYEIEDVAKKTITGYDLERALREFTEKYDSIVLTRSINLIIEGSRSGGRMADILSKIAVNVQENAILQKEMSANVTTYVIFISFASVMASPFLFGLATQLLLVIKQIAGSIATQGSSSVGFSINPDVVKVSDFRIFTFVVLTASSVMSAAIVSVIRKGSIKDGFRLLPVFWLSSVGLYYLSSWILGNVFGGLV